MPVKKKSKVTKSTSASIKRPSKSKNVLLDELADEKTSGSKISAFISRFGKKIALIFLVLLVVGLLYQASRWIILAWVDGSPVTKFEYYQLMEKRFGAETQDQLVTEKLVLSEGEKRGINVLPTQIDEELKKIKEQVGPEMFNNLLAQQKLTEEDLRKQISLQLLIKEMFSKEATVSAEEVENYLKTNSAEGEASQVPGDKQKADLVNQLKQQKISQSFSSWLQGALSSSRVVKF